MDQKVEECAAADAADPAELLVASKLSSVCRTCLTKDTGGSEGVDLYEINAIYLEECEVTSQIQSFEEVLCLFVDDEITHKKDQLPKTICLPCIEKARSAFQFIEMCRKSDAQLEKIMQEPDMEPEPKQEEPASPEKVSAVEEDISAEDVEALVEDIAEEPLEEKSDCIEIGESSVQSEQFETVLLDAEPPSGTANNAAGKLKKAHVCGICQKTFTQKQSLNRHKKIHYKDSVVKKQCNYCDREFFRADDLRRHIRTHTNERPYVCDVCSRAYKQPFELKEHKASAHPKSGVRKMLNCNLCNKTLSTRNGLYVHMKAHKGEKNHSCSFCEKKFVTSGELKSHLRRIHPAKVDTQYFFCFIGYQCMEKFATKADLKLHELRVHKRLTLKRKHVEDGTDMQLWIAQ